MPAAQIKKKRQIKRSYGPVHNPELYVHPEWWKHIFNAWYLKTDGDVVEDDSIRRFETAIFLNILSLQKEAHILDVCCGQGRHCFELLQNGYINVQGIDRSAFLISKARSRCRYYNNRIIFKEGDARHLPYAKESFDAITILGNSFGYFQSAT